MQARPGGGVVSRDWIAAYASTLRKPKYRRLSIPAKAGLFHIWLLAGGQEPEATWPNRTELEEMLVLDGWGDATDRQVFGSAQGVVDDLLASGWLDLDDEGRVLVHDWDQWQLAATGAARRAFERDRKRDWRRRKEEAEARPGLPPAPPSTDITATQHVQHNTDVPKRPGRVRDKRPAPPQEGACRTCGEFVHDTDPGVQVGPGWIGHIAHPVEASA